MLSTISTEPLKPGFLLPCGLASLRSKTSPGGYKPAWKGGDAGDSSGELVFAVQPDSVTVISIESASPGGAR